MRSEQIDRGAPEPMYQQLAQILRAQIQRGELASHARGPSITSLAADYGVAALTACHALRLLRDEP